ncbi:hypothetical protein HYS48_02620 [Candidatus Woesearchaeota archaeon]|nr:hypothetical protein [Candidatus Woesearchaeota archaeon]
MPAKRKLLSVAKGALDEVVAYDGATTTQRDWSLWYNRKDRIMAAAQDFYKVGKDGGEKLLESLQKDFRDEWVVTSTEIQYQFPSLEATVTHYFDSRVIQPMFMQGVVVPVYTYIPIEEVVKTEEGLRYLQALFQTKDDGETIITALERLSGEKRARIKIITPLQHNREYYQNRAVFFRVDRGSFIVNCYDHVASLNGRSRGVRVRER